ncbi:DUF1127 domain-containing protein [Pseudomonas typographi]|uniref:DUF1127 domain-containing protein n=1 Tax=Pseudomonas typographi TaxID=2715964 RepID=UPI0016836688|nr:DUF1127 domain-containing protein [Pseudomonas typographi]MBD1550046.1 DUF1127 domain-containing protein [Pseudomonas typographi]MBD1585428.1 DUF1127 domain-containing protein [Pseudomonas typographi]
MEQIRGVPVRLHPTEPERQCCVAATHEVGGPAGLGWLGVYIHRWRTRQQLLALDLAQLKDLGLSRADAQREGCKPFWKG